MKTYEVVRAIAKALRKEFKGIQANSYGHCCRSDYDMYHKRTNEKDHISPLIYKGGMNNDYDYQDKVFRLGSNVWYHWNLTNFSLDDVLKVMSDVARQYNFEVVRPKNNTYSILLKSIEEEE